LEWFEQKRFIHVEFSVVSVNGIARSLSRGVHLMNEAF
jgi:hypothetical protein